MPEVGNHESPALRAAYAQSLSPYMEAISALSMEAIARELVSKGGGIPRVGAVGKAVDDLAKVIQNAQQTADMIGRGETLRYARRLAGTPHGAPLAPPGPLPPAPPGGAALPPGAFPGPFGAGGAGGLPRVPFTEAVADVMAREPLLLKGATEVAAAYNEGHAFSMARAVEMETVTRAQKAVAKALHEGQSAFDAATNIRAIARKAGEDMADWTRAYSQTVAETNMATAYSAGRFRQMAEPAVASVIGALMFDGPTDSSARPNHAAAVGKVIAAPDDPVWDLIAPPLGFRCRHGLAFVDWLTLKRMGLIMANGRVQPGRIPPGAGPDKGFRHTGRPDRAIYGHAS